MNYLFTCVFLYDLMFVINERTAEVMRILQQH